jgi:hypothetical protein
MNKNMLEFWGQAFLNAARSQQQLEDLNKSFGQTTGADNPIMNSFYKASGLSNTAKLNPDGILELAKKSADIYKDFFKAYLTVFDVVPRKEHVQLVKENEELKEKIARQEKIINSYKNLSVKDSFNQEEIVTDLTQIVKNQTQQFQKLVKQVNQFYKKGSKIRNK